MLQLKTFTLSELAHVADSWDDLWNRSETRHPTTRFSGIQLWCRSFAPKSILTAIVVENDGRFVAGMPLIKDTSRWPLTSYRLTANCTVNSGDLLIDPNCDVDAATQMIARQLSQLPGMFVALEGIPIQSEHWQRLIAAMQAQGREMHVSPGHDVGVVDILHNWDAYTRSWSSNHRSAVKRSLNKLEAEGDVTVERLRNPSDDELQQVLEACFEIENKGWKGKEGTSILGTPGLREYYQQEARIMRDLGTLDLWLLKLNGQILAFEYCHFSKGTCLSHKISFDPDFDRFSPGRVLRRIQLEQYHNEPAAKQLDTLGVLCETKAKWITRSYKSSRCFFAIGGTGSNLILRFFKYCRSLAKKCRGPQPEQIAIKPGAEKYLELATPEKCTSALPTPSSPPISLPPPITNSDHSFS